MSTGKDPHEFIGRLGRRITDLMRAHPKTSMKDWRQWLAASTFHSD
jgi:hypothetical protein